MEARMRVLLTGGTGFIGRHVLGELIERGHTVRCLVRPTSDATEIDCELAVGDVTDRESVDRAIQGCDAVIHAANIYDFWLRRMGAFRAVNVDGNRNVMEAALDAGVRKFVHISSLVVYAGSPAEVPDEQSEPGNPTASEYSRTKSDGERVGWELHRTRNLPLVVVYPGGVTGAGDTKPSGRYIEALVRRKMPAQVLVKSGISWVHVRDVARVVVRALEKEDNVGERYFAAAEWLSFGELNRLITRASGVRLPWLVMPNVMLMPTAALLSFLGRIFGFTPMLGMSLDQIRTMKRGFRGDGSKAVRELGVEYESIARAVEEAVSAMTTPWQAREREQMEKIG
ncbi:MAG: NAD-dependent epimerase/dehydratase family protein [Spirochaetaceae bacterium]|nr:MAG: NAD-dependent epimerase/dehydratase family protein [Spirochaetaceae bacterium]